MKKLTAVFAALAMAGCAKNVPPPSTPESVPIVRVQNFTAPLPRATLTDTEAEPAAAKQPWQKAAPPDQPKVRAQDLPPLGDVELMADVLNRIRTEHILTNPSDMALYYGAIAGMVEALDDKYSRFLPPEKARDQREDDSSSLIGIGVEMRWEDDQIIVNKVLPAGPAARAGIKPGDVIISIDKKSVDYEAPGETTKRIRGAEGSKVVVEVRRAGEAHSLTYVIARGRVETPSVTARRVDRGAQHYVLVTISSFNEDTGEKFAELTDDVADEEGFAGIILDLRNNPGGLILQAGEVACQWLQEGQLYVETRNKAGEKKRFECEETGDLVGVPAVVLVNRHSASSSEIVAGALQDHGHALVIGERTFGKGCGQNVKDFKDGSRLVLLAFLWYTPKGRTIHKTGIEPDVFYRPAKKVPPLPQDQPDLTLERAMRYLQNGK